MKKLIRVFDIDEGRTLDSIVLHARVEEAEIPQIQLMLEQNDLALEVLEDPELDITGIAIRLCTMQSEPENWREERAALLGLKGDNDEEC